MKKTTSIVLISVAFLLLSLDLPTGWHIAGNQPKKYEMGLDKGAGPNGKNVATIRSIKKKIYGFGTLMQQSLPDKYLGKRVRMIGYMKSAHVDMWAAFWFRVDRADTKETHQSLSFDNMQDRPVKGTTDWKKYEIVLDVPADASSLAYGALLAGTGQVWFDNIDFEIVDNSVPTTGKWINTLKEPTNLNFEQ